MKYYIVDAFTREPFGGNPAGVVLLDGDFPDERLMQFIAAELRYSETVFVQQQGYDEFTMRYFTPASEVDLCGHATIAAFHLLHVKGMLRDDWPIVNHTLAGDLMVSVTPQVMMQMAPPQVLDKSVDAARLHRIMSPGDESTGWPDLPIDIISTGLPDIILPVGSLEALNALSPDMEALTELSRELAVVGVHAYVTTGDGFTAHVRNFAPLYNVPEESATGTANAALTHYLSRHGMITSPADCRFLQGEAMRRPSIVSTTLRDDGSIWVGGESVILAHGDLMV